MCTLEMTELVIMATNSAIQEHVKTCLISKQINPKPKP
jgi:hypothetical protein